MVSTRGVKFKFSEGEKVLCYEPDPSKAKVLYDSKVLEVVQKGRKSVEYLIHFQGWNSSWDRCVPEEYVLRDTEENRQLQKRLAEKAQLQLGVFFYRKERGRQRRNKQLSDFGKESHSDNSGSDEDNMDDDISLDLLEEVDDEEGLMDDEDEDVDEDLDDEEEDDNEEDEDEENKENEHENEQHGGEPEDKNVPLEFPKEFKRYLDLDWFRINKWKMQVRIPADPSAFSILEMYVKEYARDLLTADEESKGGDSDQESKLSSVGPIRSKLQKYKKQRKLKRQRRISSSSSCEDEPDKEYQEIERNVNLCQDVMQSLRFYLDFMLGNHLLYPGEQAKYMEVCQLLEDTKDCEEIYRRHNPLEPPPVPVQQRILAKMDSDSEDQGKSDTEAELLEMISAADPTFTQRWNDLLRDVGCEVDPPEPPVVIKSDEALDVDILPRSKSRGLRNLNHSYKDMSSPERLAGKTEDEDPSCNQYQLRSAQRQRHPSMQSNDSTEPLCPIIKTDTLSNASCSRNSERGPPSRSVKVGADGTVAVAIPMIPPLSGTERRNALRVKMEEWKLVDEQDEFDNTSPPILSKMYGAIHLARLLVKLPEYLHATKLPDGHIRVIQRHLNMFIVYLTKHPRWFGDKHYYNDMDSQIAPTSE